MQHYGFIVKAGFFSPVHDKYPKDTLTSITHRVAMLKLALETSDWLQVSTWESEQTSWIPTYNVLNHHQVLLISVKKILLLRSYTIYILVLHIFIYFRNE